MNNFYITGGTIGIGAESYVERRADVELYESLKRGEYCYVLTSRQMGKSSLMVRVGTRLRKEGTKVIVLDLTGIGQNLEVEQWYVGIIVEIGEQVGKLEEMEEEWERGTGLGSMHRWVRCIRRLIKELGGKEVVIFIDEIDSVRSLKFSADEFFAGIRELYNLRVEEEELEKLSICLLGVARPKDLISDTRVTPFNIGKKIELSDFKEEEVGVLLKGLGLEEAEGKEVMKRVMYWTGGQPYLTQKLCMGVVGVSKREEVDEISREMYIGEGAVERDDNLMFVRERVLRSEVGVGEMLDKYEEVLGGRKVRDEEGSRVIEELKLSGLVRVEGSRLRVRNQIYREVFDRKWVREHRPDIEVKRRRVAFLKGLGLASGIFVMVMIVVGYLAGKAYVEARRADKQVEENRRILYATRMNLAQQAYDRRNIGRVIELLERAKELGGEGGEDLRGYEWYYLWEVCHRDYSRSMESGRAAWVVKYSADGKEVYVGTDEGMVKAWNVESGEELWSFKAHDLKIYGLDISPNGNSLVTGGTDGTICMWDVKTQRQITNVKAHEGDVRGVAFSPDGTMVASGGTDGKLVVWESKNLGKYKEVYKYNGLIFGVNFSPDGKYLAVVGSKGMVSVFQTGKWQPEMYSSELNEVYTLNVVFSKNGKLMAIGRQDGKVKIWNVGQWKEQEKELIIQENEVEDLTFTSDGKSLITGDGDGMIKVWDLNGNQIKEYIGHRGKIYKLIMSPDGAAIASCSEDRSIKIWGLNLDNDRNVLRASSGLLWNIAISLDGTKVVSVGGDGNVVVWDIATRQKLRFWHAHNGQIRNAVFSNDGKKLITDGWDKTIKVWDFNSGQLLNVFDGSKDWVTTLTISHNGKYIAAGSKDGVVWIFELDSWRLIARLSGPNFVAAVKFSPDDKLLCAVGADETARIWKVESQQEIAILKHNSRVRSAAFSPDGKTLTTGDFSGIVRFWSTSTWQEIGHLNGHNGVVWDLTYFPDGTRIVTGSGDQTIKIWDSLTFQELLTLSGHTGWVTGIALTPDNKTLVSASWDGTVRLWPSQTR